MAWFKLLFLYFLLSGFLCYGDSYSYGIKTQQVLENPNSYSNSKSLYYIVSGQQWDELPDEVKTNLLQTSPEFKPASSTYELDTWDIVGHYLGSLKRAKSDEVLRKIRSLNEVYRVNTGIKDFAFDKRVYNKDILKALIIETITPHRAEMEGISDIMFINKYAPNNIVMNKGRRINITPNTFYQVSEPIGGGGGAGGSLRTLKKYGTQAHFEFIPKAGQKVQWAKIIKEGKDPESSLDLWIIAPSHPAFDNSITYYKHGIE